MGVACSAAQPIVEYVIGASNGRKILRRAVSITDSSGNSVLLEHAYRENTDGTLTYIAGSRSVATRRYDQRQCAAISMVDVLDQGVATITREAIAPRACQSVSRDKRNQRGVHNDTNGTGSISGSGKAARDHQRATEDVGRIIQSIGPETFRTQAATRW